MSQCNPSEHPSYRRGSTPADPNGHQSLRSNGIIPRPGYGYLPEETGAVQVGQNGCWRWTGNSGRSAAVCRASPILFLHHMAAARFSNSTPSFPLHSPFPFPRRGAVRDSTNLISLYYAVCQACPPIPGSRHIESSSSCVSRTQFSVLRTARPIGLGDLGWAVQYHLGATATATGGGTSSCPRCHPVQNGNHWSPRPEPPDGHRVSQSQQIG